MRILSKKMKRANTYAQIGRNRKLLSKVKEIEKEIDMKKHSLIYLRIKEIW